VIEQNGGARGAHDGGDAAPFILREHDDIAFHFNMKSKQTN
jgi:hypothetical protein